MKSIPIIGLVGRVFANGPRDRGSIPGHVIPKTLKMVLDTSSLNTQHTYLIRYVSRVKWSNPGKGVAPSPTQRCSSYWKGSLLVALDYDRQLYFYLLLKKKGKIVWYHSLRQRMIRPFYFLFLSKWLVLISSKRSLPTRHSLCQILSVRHILIKMCWRREKYQSGFMFILKNIMDCHERGCKVQSNAEEEVWFSRK